MHAETAGELTAQRAITMSEWSERVARWKATFNITMTASAADLIEERRDLWKQRARRLIERDWS